MSEIKYGILLSTLFLLMFGILAYIIVNAPTPAYNIVEVSKCVPDSNKTKYVEYTTQLVKNASSNLTTADYEHPDDLLEASRDMAFELYSVPVYGLKQGDSHPIEEGEFTKEQRKIFDSLRVK